MILVIAGLLLALAPSGPKVVTLTFAAAESDTFLGLSIVGNSRDNGATSPRCTRRGEGKSGPGSGCRGCESGGDGRRGEALSATWNRYAENLSQWRELLSAERSTHHECKNWLR